MDLHHQEPELDITGVLSTTVNIRQSYESIFQKDNINTLISEQTFWEKEDKEFMLGISLAIQWLTLHTQVVGAGLLTGQGTKNLHVSCGSKIKNKKIC